jgi:nucleoside-diphosphate-sugar epimerase
VTTLVTGAGGLLGSHVVELLVEAGSRPRALFAPCEAVLASTAVDVRVGDVRDRSVVEAALDGVDAVVHCAARTGPWGPSAEYESTNVRALETLVRLAREAGIRRIVHVSSITVHGNDVRGTADETAPFRVEPNPYSRSKVVGERVLQRLIDDGAPVTIVRPGWIYGPRDNGSFGRFANMIEAGRMLVIGPGHNHVPLVYVGDAARGALQAADAEGAVGRAYLLVNDEPVTQREYLVAIAQELGAPALRWHLPYRVGLALGAAAEIIYRAARREGPPPLTRFGVQLLGGENRYRIDRARTELGFTPEVMLTEGVKRSVEWYLTQSHGGG